MRVDSANREITCKVVYYGPGMSGKTTNLQQIHDRAPSRSVGELVTLDTHSERTLHFDLLPVEVGEVNGYAIRFEFYTVPGQSYYASTRRLVLEGADGVVFVSDSRREALDENIDSMNDLLDNLRHLNLPADLPVVIQYNKQDLPSAVKPEQLDPLLNSRHWPSHTAIAIHGAGVLETMRTISMLIMERVKAKTTSPSGGNRMRTPAPTNPTWLISCYRCKNMLETSGAKIGDLFTCGACGTPLEITDLDRGLTQAPQVQQRVDIPPPPPSSRNAGRTTQIPAPIPREDSGGYGLQPLPEPGAALQAQTGTADLGAGFELPGFESQALLEDTIQGRRFRVRESQTGARYRALVLNSTLMRQPGYAAQVDPYVRMAAAIKHANLLPLHSMHQGREAPILLSGDPPDHESLSHVLARRRTLAPPHAMQVARQIVLACEESARHGVVHGWLRPDIILLNAESQTLVDEFGVPKNHRYLVRELSGASAATEYYLAPEHLSDDSRSDIRSDMFMLGAMLFRMLTGEGLITGYTCHEALHKAAAQGCRRARSVQPNLSRDIDAFVARLTSVERKDRFQAWNEVLAICERFGGGAKVQTFRLTQGHTAGAATGATRRTVTSTQARHQTGSHQRGQTGAHTRPHTAPHTRQQTGGFTRPQTGGFARGGDLHTPRTTMTSRKQSGNGGVIVLLVVLLLAAAGAVAFLIGRQPPRTAGTATESPPPAPPRINPPGTPVPRTAPPGTQTPTTPVTTGPKGGEAGPNSRLPTFLNPGVPVTPGPVGTTPVPTPPVATIPTVPTPPPLAPGDADFSALMLQIADLERQDRFRAALDLCEKLPAEARQVRSADVFARHQARRAETSAAVRKATDPDEARNILQKVLILWNMPGDAEWAQNLLKEIGTAAPPATGAIPRTPVAPLASATSPAGIAWTVEQILVQHDVIKAQQAANGLPPGPDQAAINQRISLWKDRTAILAPAVAAKRRVLRITTPGDSQQWDVVGVEDGGLTVASSTGSTTRLDWPLVPIRELARIASEAAYAGNPPVPREYALAIVMLTAAGDTALATVQLNKAKAILPADLAEDLEHSLALHRQYESTGAIERVRATLTAGNLKLASEQVDALRKLAKDPTIAAALPALEDSLKRLEQGLPASGGKTVPAKDRLVFDTEEDLASLPQREGGWSIEGGSLVTTAASGSVARRDVDTAKSMQLIFQPMANRGAAVVNFRGVRVLLDFKDHTLTASTRDVELKPVDAQFVPRTVQNLYIEIRPTGDVLLEMNNGVITLDLKLQKGSDTLSVGYDTGASLSIDEISVVREDRQDPAAEAARIAAIKAIGFEPIGQAKLVPPAIHLPDSTPRSGLGFARRDGVDSFTIEVKGTGKLEVRFGKLGEGGGQSVQLDLGPTSDTPMTYTIGCGRQVWVRQGDTDGELLVEDKLLGDPPHVMIIATKEAFILQTPRLNRQ